MTHPHDRAKETERQARRARVAALLLAGVTDQRRIAEQLDVSQPTISRDIRAIEADWQATAVQDIAAAKGKDLERIERAVAGIWPKVKNGDERAVAQFVNLLQRRAKLLGLDAPQRQEHTGRDGEPIQHEHRNAATAFAPDELDMIATAIKQKREGRGDGRNVA